jgi:transposase-like protein
MATSAFNKPHFQNDEAARAYLAALRWPNGAVCPHCGSIDKHYELKGESHRAGLYKCLHCRKQFSVTVGTVFERSKIALHVWFKAVYLLCSSKKGMSSHQLHRTLGVTYKTAWFMTHRIREAMRPDNATPFGKGGSGVEVDETFFGKSGIPPSKKGTGYRHLNKVLSLVDRKSGQARSMVIDNLKASTIVPILRENIAQEARVLTDDAGQYRGLSLAFERHNVVNHKQGEYVSFSDRTAHTNTIEGFFSIFKRGMKGVYQHCGKQHLHRYLAEFDFRYSQRERLDVNDSQRANVALKGIGGKRLTYRRTGGSAQI